MKTTELSVEQAAKNAAGNWNRFESFVWFRAGELKDSDNWAIFYTHHRDSGLLDISNASVIRKELQSFTTGSNPDVEFESHNHWLVGCVDGFCVRVYRRGKITKAFRKYHEILERMNGYPILDEQDYSNREYDATFKNIESAAWRLKKEYELPEFWVDGVYSWLSENESMEIENVDDQGGYPSEESLKRAFEGLEYEKRADS